MFLWSGHVAKRGETRNAFRIFVGKPLVKRPLVKPRMGSKDNIKMDLPDIGCEAGGRVDVNVSGPCPMAGFGISGVAPLGPTTTVIVNYFLSAHSKYSKHSRIQKDCEGGEGLTKKSDRMTILFLQKCASMAPQNIRYSSDQVVVISYLYVRYCRHESSL
jgi:hypothetical protein